MRNIHSTLILAFAALLLNGCGGRKPEQPPPRVESTQRYNAQDTAPAEEKDKRGFISRIFTADGPAGYAWDGNFSSVKIDTAPEAVYDASVRTLREMGFIIRGEESVRSATGGKIGGAKTDKTTVQVLVERKDAKGETKTELKAKVGFVGDRTGSERVLELIQRSLAPRRAPTK